MEKKVLVLGPSIDKSTYVVVRKLEERGIPVFVFYPDKVYEYSFQVEVDMNGMWKGRLAKNDVSVNFPEGASAIWIRRPWVREEWVKDVIPHPDMQSFAVNEFNEVLRNLLVTAHAPKLSEYYAIRRSGHLLVQFQIAQQVGLRVPRTIVTADVEAALRFASEVDMLCVKPLTDAPPIDGLGWGGYTYVIDADQITKFSSSFKLAPVLLQEYVDKDFELRITVVGERVFAAKLETQLDPRTQMDWRRYVHIVPHSPYVLPYYLESKLVELVRRLDLNFGAIDMVVSKEGEFVFLEVNPNGQWQWIEDKTGLPISDAITDWLTEAHLSEHVG